MELHTENQSTSSAPNSDLAYGTKQLAGSRDESFTQAINTFSVARLSDLDLQKLLRNSDST